MDVLTPRTLEEALELKAQRPDARFIQGGTDVMVELNFGHSRPPAIVNLAELEELRGWSEEGDRLRLGAGLTYTEAMASPLAERLPALAEASRTVGSPQIRNRGTLGGNLGTGSPAGDALPPLLVEGANVELASVRGVRALPLHEFLLGVKRTALEPDELITSVRLTPSGVRSDLHEGRPAKRDGDRRLLARGRGRRRRRTGPGSVWIGRRHGQARHGAACERGHPARPGRRGGEPDRRRPWQRRLSSARVACPRCPGAGEVPALVRITLTVNGEQREADLWGGESLLEMLRDTLELPGSKNACEQGECGSCSVVLDGELVCSCLVLAAQADGHEVVTVEGLARDHELHPVQDAFVEAGAVQCGFCTPGLVVAVADLLERVPDPTDDEVREALSGNVCRCTGYVKIFDAVRLAAERR